MGKKRKTQEVQRGPKKLKAYNCPVCHQPSCVRVQIKREEEKATGSKLLIGTCICNECNRKYKVPVSAMDSAHQVYMHWVQYQRDLSTFGVRCPHCQVVCVLYLTEPRGEQAEQYGEIQCTKCRTTYGFLMQSVRTRAELAERINKYKLSPYYQNKMTSVSRPGRKASGGSQRSQRQRPTQDQEQSDEQPRAHRNRISHNSDDQTEESSPQSDFNQPESSAELPVAEDIDQSKSSEPSQLDQPLLQVKQEISDDDL